MRNGFLKNCYICGKDILDMIQRQLKPQIVRLMGSGKAIIIMGARQVGKSTLLHDLFDGQKEVLWLNGDDPDVQRILKDITSTRLKAFLANKQILIIDEAQPIWDIGLKIKLITDQIPEVQVVATGSSNFELANKVNESLTGRKREYRMFPLSFKEMADATDLLTEQRMIPHRLVYGYYPEVVTNPGDEREVLRELSSSYLYKDILQLDGIAKPDKLETLIQALARQIGNIISYRELSQLVGIDAKTIERYIDLLEKSYVVFRLGSFSRNLRNELKNGKKIYFWDMGIRNAVIGDFRPAETREDVGALWENFVLAERLKQISYSRSFTNIRFWRTTEQKEIDIIEETDGRLSAYEIKWNPKKVNTKVPAKFADAYPEAEYRVITPENVFEYIL